MNEYSNKDFTGWDLSARTDMSGIIIEGSCFSHETPDSHCLPPDLTGTTFIDCNLDNVVIPEGNTVIRGSNKRFEAQNDLEDWIVDDNNNPDIPINVKTFQELGLSTEPDDIPTEELDKPITVLAQEGGI